MNLNFKFICIQFLLSKHTNPNVCKARIILWSSLTSTIELTCLQRVVSLLNRLLPYLPGTVSSFTLASPLQGWVLCSRSSARIDIHEPRVESEPRSRDVYILVQARDPGEWNQLAEVMSWLKDYWGRARGSRPELAAVDLPQPRAFSRGYSDFRGQREMGVFDVFALFNRCPGELYELSQYSLSWLSGQKFGLALSLTIQ